MWNKKNGWGGGGNKNLKRGQTRIRGGCLKKRGLEPHYELWVSDGGIRDVLVSGNINRGDDFNAKVQKVNEILSEIRTRKNVKYIDNGNTSLVMLNQSKLHVSRFGSTQLVNNCLEILKI